MPRSSNKAPSSSKKWTDERYYADREYVTGSMCRAYLRSPGYYRAKFVENAMPDELTPSMLLGQAVDTYVTTGPASFLRAFARKIERSCLKSEDPDRYAEETAVIAALEASGKRILSPAQYDRAVQVSRAVARTSAYKWLVAGKNGPRRQLVLLGELNGLRVKGKLDFLNVVGDTAYVTDLKTSSSVDGRRYFWHCADLGYDVQMALYAELVRQNYPSVGRIVARHLAVSTGDWPEVRCFEFSMPMLKGGEARLRYALDGIREGRLDDPDSTWEDAEVLGQTVDFSGDGEELASA